MTTLKRLYEKLFVRPSIEEIAAYQHKIPRTIQVEISHDKKTKYWTARVTSLDGKKVMGLLITEAKEPLKLVDMVNDAVLTYLDFPDYIKPSMPDLLPEDLDFDALNAKRNVAVFAK